MLCEPSIASGALAWFSLPSPDGSRLLADATFTATTGFGFGRGVCETLAVLGIWVEVPVVVPPRAPLDPGSPLERASRNAAEPPASSTSRATTPMALGRVRRGSWGVAIGTGRPNVGVGSSSGQGVHHDRDLGGVLPGVVGLALQELLEVLLHGLAARVAVVGILGQGALQDHVEAVGQVGLHGGGARYGRAQVLLGELDEARPAVRASCR